MGGSVNQGAVQQEQQNQDKAQNYAAQQQAAALQAVNGWIGQNKPPGQTHAPMTPPQASSPATMGGGVINAQKPQQPMQPPMGAQPPAGPPAMNPQLRQQIMMALRGQGGAM